MNLLPIQKLPRLWETDGSLRDVYVLDTSAQDWKAFLKFAIRFPHTYSFDGEERRLPEIELLFKNRTGSHLLSINVGKVTVNCHFFIEEEIELDINPKEIEGQAEHYNILYFMQCLAESVAKPILLTPENSPETPYLCYEPISHTWRVCL